MTPPASILAPDRDRASAAAWGTLCVLAGVQLGVLAALIVSHDPTQAKALPTLEVPATATASPQPPSRTVPEIGLLGQPAARISPPMPGTLAGEPVSLAIQPASNSNGPPPIGSFQREGMPPPAVAPLIPVSNTPPALPGSSMARPKLAPLPGSSADSSPPPLPGSSMERPPLPGSSMATPPMPGSIMEKPPLPGSSMAPPPLPGSSMPTPVMPDPSSLAPPALPGSSMKTPAMPDSGAPPPALPGSTMPKPAPVKPDAATALLQDVNYVVTSAKEIRGMSDMQGALELLQKADQVNPDHPAIIAEIAQTYEQMGIKGKATDSWRRIQLLGETKAGSYYELAARRLGGGPAAAAAPQGLPGMGGMEGEKHLRLGACQVARDFSANSGERYALRVPIQRAGSQPVDGNMVNMEVFFFDRVNGVQVAQTIAPEPVETWQSSPVDWSGAGEETLDVVYHLPALSPAEIQQHGRRSYYGYMLRLYYNNKLQDVAAEPRDLLEFGSAPGAAAAGGNPLLPPVGR